MTGGDIIDEVLACLPREMKQRIGRSDVRIIFSLIFETITEYLFMGCSVSIRNFGKIFARFKPGGKKFFSRILGREVETLPSLKLFLKPSKQMRKELIWDTMKFKDIREKKKKEEMEKFGYEPEDERKGTKQASKKDKCPKCGSTPSGYPPVCPKCGSEPFEKQYEKGHRGTD